MKTITELLDLAKTINGIKSDRQLATALGKTSVHQYRTKGVIPEDDTAIRLAELCTMKPETVVALCHMAKAKTPEESNLWKHFYKMAASACLVLVLSAGVFTPTTAQANEEKSFLSCSTSYPLCDVIN